MNRITCVQPLHSWPLSLSHSFALERTGHIAARAPCPRPPAFQWSGAQQTSWAWCHHFQAVIRSQEVHLNHPPQHTFCESRCHVRTSLTEEAATPSNGNEVVTEDNSSRFLNMLMAGSSHRCHRCRILSSHRIERLDEWAMKTERTKWMFTRYS